MLFHEGWTRAPMAQPLTQANLANQQLTLHIYGDPNQIRKAMHPLDDYTYTGETTTNWALTTFESSARITTKGTKRTKGTKERRPRVMASLLVSEVGLSTAGDRGRGSDRS